MFFKYLDTKCDRQEAIFLPDHDFEEYIASCGSPIEQIFRYAFDIICIENDLFLILDYQDAIVCGDKTYIADFTFDTETYFSDIYKCEHELKLVIECDGHEFHAKTKEQVKRGNERDLALKLEGYDVLHFSGSQIYNDPFGCARDTVNYICNKIGKIERL